MSKLCLTPPIWRPNCGVPDTCPVFFPPPPPAPPKRPDTEHSFSLKYKIFDTIFDSNTNFDTIFDSNTNFDTIFLNINLDTCDLSLNPNPDQELWDHPFWSSGRFGQTTIAMCQPMDDEAGDAHRPCLPRSKTRLGGFPGALIELLLTYKVKCSSPMHG